jgi:hypothetical protein
MPGVPRLRIVPGDDCREGDDADIVVRTPFGAVALAIEVWTESEWSRCLERPEQVLRFRNGVRVTVRPGVAVNCYP